MVLLVPGRRMRSGWWRSRGLATLHGVFDGPGVAEAVLRALCERKGADFARLGAFDAAAYKEQQYDLLADAVRSGLDMEFVYRVLNREV